jgi:Raf kinase inhibitor-like YbhB/YbcL family protein
MEKLLINSPAFENNRLIPAKYTCDGSNVNPPLTIENIPAETKTLVLIVDDPDCPTGTFDHWIVWNISPITRKIGENTIPGTEGISSYRKHAYGGPCPPYGTHRYFFKVYALDTQLDLKSNSTKKDVEKVMENHILAEGRLIGLYSRSL